MSVFAGAVQAGDRLPVLHRAWLDEQSRDLLRFGRRFPHPSGGAAYLGSDGTPDFDAPVQTWITARMCHVYALGALAGVPGSRPLAQSALDGLRMLTDVEHGGWLRGVEATGGPLEAGAKSCYDHAFVLLASSSATVAGLDGARPVLDAAIATFLERFWDDVDGMCVDGWDRTWSRSDAYRGVNANMHAVEAFLAVGECLGQDVWYDRALRIARRVIDAARPHDWRIPEHYDENWAPRLDFNADDPTDQFKPFGATVGHGLEWARLLAQLATVCDSADGADLVRAGRALFARAVKDGWAVDAYPGFVYTTDWDGVPVVRERMHWVVAEAIAAAWALYDASGDPDYLRQYHQWWDHVAACFLDEADGSWHHELSARNTPSSTVWSGKPDLYHAFQATLVPRLPRRPGLARALAEGALR